MNCLIARHKVVPEKTTRPNSSSQRDLCTVVDALRCRGYAVYLDAACAATRPQVTTRAARFVESALAVAGNPKSGQAYIRVSGSTKSLLVEVTRLTLTAHDALARDDAALIALDALRQWASSHDEWLSMERGPRGQLRIATVIRTP